MITVASLFDGIGGTPLCATMCGAVPVWASEIEKFPIQVTKHHFPEMKHYGDITKIGGAQVEPVDVIVGGSPCQDLSVAGKRAGLAGGRSGLFMEQVRIIREMREKHGADKPRYMVWENVPGAFSSNDGEDFRAVLEETARIADPTVSIPRSVDGWANAGSILADGWSLSWRTIDAQYWGVPQRRRRIYLVADFGCQSAPEILFEREGLRWDSTQGGTAREGTSGEASECARGAITLLMREGCAEGGKGPLIQNERTGALCTAAMPTLFEPVGVHGDISGTLDSNYHKGCGERGGTEREVVAFVKAKRAQSETDDDRWEESVVAPTQNAFDVGDTRATTVLAFSHTQDPDAMDGKSPCMGHDGIAIYDITHGSMAQESIGVTPTLLSRMGTGGNQVPVTMSTGQANAEILEGMCPTLNCNHEQPIVSTSTVRRLTPTECERLQGYPDGWTDIPGASDSARYKSLGNSFAIPCAFFVISGCVEQIQKENKWTTST